MLNRLLESQFFDPWNELSQKKSLNKFASLEKQFQIEPIYHQSYYFQFSQFIKNIPFRVETCTIELIIRSKIFQTFLFLILCRSCVAVRLPRDRSRCAPQRIWRLSVGTRHQYININTRRNRYINVGQRCRVSYHPCITTGKMEFLSFDVKNYTLELRKADVPNPGPNDVRIRVAYSGICGTDLHILEVRRRSSAFFIR